MKIERMNKGEWGKLRAFFDIRTDDGFVIKGFKIMDSINGLFVSMPSQKGKDEEWFDTVWVDKDLRDQLNQVAIEAYNNDSFNSNNQEATSKQTTTEQAEPAMPEELSPTDNTESVQPFDDKDIPF